MSGKTFDVRETLRALGLTEDPEGINLVFGSKEDLDSAYMWASAYLSSALGPEEGQRALQSMPALIGFALWNAALEGAPEA